MFIRMGNMCIMIAVLSAFIERRVDMMRLILLVIMMNVFFVSFVDDSWGRFRCVDMEKDCKRQCDTQMPLNHKTGCNEGCRIANEICIDQGGYIGKVPELSDGGGNIDKGRKDVVFPIYQHQWDDQSEFTPQDSL